MNQIRRHLYVHMGMLAAVPWALQQAGVPSRMYPAFAQQLPGQKGTQQFKINGWMKVQDENPRIHRLYVICTSPAGPFTKRRHVPKAKYLIVNRAAAVVACCFDLAAGPLIMSVPLT